MPNAPTTADPDLAALQRASLRLLWDVRELSLVLGISERHAVAMADAGELPPPVYVGRCRRWSRAAIESWIGEQAGQTAPAGTE